MTSRRRLRDTCLLAAFLSLPILASGQESQAKEESKEKKDGLTKVETTEEHREGLDRKLDSSLSEFDALILKEQEILEKRREAEAAAGGSGGAGTAEVGGNGSGGEGSGTAAEGSEGSEGTGDERSGKTGTGETSTGEATGTGGSPDEPAGGETTTEGNAPEGGYSGPNNTKLPSNRVPPDVGDGRDDDIVARQLREAAMKEEDPELREKLWDEYRAYKFGEKKGEKKKDTGGDPS
jgi:hypothetical protein